MSEQPPLNELLEIINELYLYQLGPFGAIICEEAEEAWRTQHRRVNPSLLPAYLKLLIVEIERPESVEEFVRDLKAHEELTNEPRVLQYLESL